MFPCRFAHWEEKAEDEVFTGPFVNKVRKRAGYYNEDCTCDGIKF